LLKNAFLNLWNIFKQISSLNQIDYSHRVLNINVG
jgi:hypothetical protein